MAVELRYEKSDNPSAFLVQFTNGELKCDGDEASLPAVTLLEPEDASNARNANRRILLAETSRMTYSGKNFGPDRHPDTFCKYLVGVMDRLKGEMTLHDALSITMHPKPNIASAESGEETATVDESYREKYAKMIGSFGSGKKKKLIETQQDSHIEHPSLELSMAAAKDYALTEADDDRPSLDEYQMLNQTRLIPPFNKDATDPMEVFKLEDLITPEEYFAIKDEARVFVEAKQKTIDEWKAEKKYPEYVLGQVELLWTMTVSKAVKRRARCLMYLSYLVAIYKTPHRDFNEKGLKQFSLPSEVESRIQKVFTELYAAPGRKPCRVITPHLRDKLLMYILVLALYIEKFSFDCTLLARDLGLQPQKMGEYWRAVGGKMKIVQPKKKDSDQTIHLTVELKVPFNLPTLGKRFAQRKR